MVLVFVLVLVLTCRAVASAKSDTRNPLFPKFVNHLSVFANFCGATQSNTSHCCSVRCLPSRSCAKAGSQRSSSLVHPYFSSQARPSVIILISLPPPSGLTKIVSSASPRFRFSIAEAGVMRSLPCFVQPCALRFADNSAQALFTFALLLTPRCS